MLRRKPSSSSGRDAGSHAPTPPPPPPPPAARTRDAAAFLVVLLALAAAYRAGVREGRAHATAATPRAVAWTPDGGGGTLLYGHVHVAKTGGTSLNGLLANRYERVCGHKGYSYDAYGSNERAKALMKLGKRVKLPRGKAAGKPQPEGQVPQGVMLEIGFENCDYVSHEPPPNGEHGAFAFWIDTFGDRRFHGTPMELHVPCRDPVEHLMSQCNHRKLRLECNATNDEAFYRSIDACLMFLDRYGHPLKEHFDVKCIDFQGQFTAYMDHLETRLQPRRFVSVPYVRRETNEPRREDEECIWKSPELLEKAKAYLLKTVEYYQFCNECLGSTNELTRGGDR